MVCCICFKADVEGYKITDEHPNVYWAMCVPCMERYEGDTYILQWEDH